MDLKKIKNKVVVLSTVGVNEKPHSVVCEINKIDNKEIIITDNFMKTTLYNINKNPNVCIVYHDSKNGVRIDGKAKYYNSGKWLELVKSLPENKGYSAKGAIVIEIEEITELG